MQNEIIINADPGETRVAILERSTFTELHIERDHDRSVVGNVVKGRVMRVLPGMQAAFVDIGLDKAAFLYAGDYFANVGDGEEPPRRGRRNGRGAPPRIDTMLSEGQEIVVQIGKEPIGTKGARITSNISIPGRHLVLTPWSRRVGVSRRIESDRERKRLREIVERLRPKDIGFIIRTAGDGVREADLEADIRYLASVWTDLQTRNREAPCPSVLYGEPDLALRMIRDFATSETLRIAVDSERVHAELKDFLEQFVADPRPKLDHYKGPAPIFDRYELEPQIDSNLGRKVWLKSGGHLVIDQSEALTAIDVNTGRFTGKRDVEETVLKTNLEAVAEVVHQLRFRNIGGLIIIDLIDMEPAEHRERVYRALQDALRADKARTNILKISELGLVEMTRKRTRENLVQTLCEPCAYCEGRGYVLSRESVAFRVMREIRKDLPRFGGRRIAVTVNPLVAEQLLSSRSHLDALGEELGREIEVRARPGVHQEQFEVTALDSGDPVEIPLRWLGAPDTSDAAEEKTEEKKPRRSRKRAARKPAAARGEAETVEAVSEEAQAEPEAPREASAVVEATAAAAEEKETETTRAASSAAAAAELDSAYPVSTADAEPALADGDETPLATKTAEEAPAAEGTKPATEKTEPAAEARTPAAAVEPAPETETPGAEEREPASASSEAAVSLSTAAAADSLQADAPKGAASSLSATVPADVAAEGIDATGESRILRPSESD